MNRGTLVQHLTSYVTGPRSCTKIRVEFSLCYVLNVTKQRSFSGREDGNKNRPLIKLLEVNLSQVL